MASEQDWINEKLKKVLISGQDIEDIPDIPTKLKEALVTAHQVSPEWHIRIQAAFQANIDNAVSKTVNLPADATVEDIGNVFQFAYDLKCKGVTVYRDNSRQNQVLSAVQQREESDLVSFQPRPRASFTIGKTMKFRMGCGTLFVTVNKDEEGICEVFANLGKAGGCPSQSEATCRAISAALRSGVDPKVLIDQLSNIRCLSTAVARKTNKEVDVLSCPDAIAKALEDALGLLDISENHLFTKKCPDCGQILRFESGCDICKNCGFSNCG